MKLAVRNLFIFSCLGAVLHGCGGGGGGVSIAGNSAQDPDPVVVDFPVAYVKRALPTDDNGDIIADNILEPDAFNPGGGLYLRDRANASAIETNISASAFGANAQYDVKDVNASYDGNQLVFAMRAPEIENSDIQPTWNIWLYELESKTLRRLIDSDNTAEAGEDIAPYFLPDGRIVFSSTRQTRSKAIQLDSFRSRFSALTDARNTEAFVLHVIENDGSNIQQITFNQSHDLNPVVREDGKIIYLRWDRAQRNNLSFYSVNPDGSEQEILYGYHSQNTGTNDIQATFIDSQILPNGQILSILKPRTSDRLGGDLVAVNSANFTDINQATTANAGDTNPGQATISLSEVDLSDGISPHGYFNSAYPLYDGSNRLLVSWSPCRLYDGTEDRNIACTDENLALPGVIEADPLYSLWIYDLDQGIQRPVMTPEENVMVTDAVSLEVRSNPTFLPPLEVSADTNLLNAGLGELHIRSVYDLDGVATLPDGTIEPDAITRFSNLTQTNAADRPARFLRIVKPINIPDNNVINFDNNAFGVSTASGMREILGYVPIEPDGSVKVKLPADVAFTLEILDASGQRISQPHRNWLQLKAGEQKNCTGCHVADSTEPHGRLNAELTSINTGAPSSGYTYPGTEAALFSESAGETMAEIYARINGTREPSMDVLFTDDWTAGTKDPDISFTYAAITALPGTDAPATPECQTAWNGSCRSLINYESHIQPLWEAARPDDTGCTVCHNRSDVMNNAQVPAGQLELTNQASVDVDIQMASYRDLLAPDIELELDGATLVARRIQSTDGDGNLLFELDDDGNQVLDADGNPVPILETVPVTNSLVAGSVAASQRFFDTVTGQTTVTVDHTGLLNDSELRLIREWVDIGAQYYNNPEDAPLN